MKKLKIFGGFAFIVLVGLAVLTGTKPDRAAHYDIIKKEFVRIIDREINSNPILKEYAAMGTLRALDAMDEYMGRFLIVREHTFYTVGIIIYKDYMIPVSVGAAGHVWLTVDDKDLQRMAESPDIQNLIGEDIKQIQNILMKSKAIR